MNRSDIYSLCAIMIVCQVFLIGVGVFLLVYATTPFQLWSSVVFTIVNIFGIAINIKTLMNT